MAERIDLQVILEEVLIAAREHGAKAAESNGEFERGLKMAYYDILTIAKEQAELLGVPLSDIGLEGFDPDRELLHVVTKKNAA